MIGVARPQSATGVIGPRGPCAAPVPALRDVPPEECPFLAMHAACRAVAGTCFLSETDVALDQHGHRPILAGARFMP